MAPIKAHCRFIHLSTKELLNFRSITMEQKSSTCLQVAN